MLTQVQTSCVSDSYTCADGFRVGSTTTDANCRRGQAEPRVRLSRLRCWAGYNVVVGTARTGLSTRLTAPLMAVAVAVALAAAAVQARAAPAGRGLSYIDLVTEGRLATPAGAATPGLVGCGDQTWNALTLAHGAALGARVSLAHEPTLVLGGCREPGAPDVLMVQIEPRFGPTRRLRVPIGGGPGAFLTRVYLDGLGGATAAVRVEPHFTRGTIYLEDFYVAHEADRPVRPSPPPAGILLISVDTLRADSIAALGGSWPTPHLDRLVATSESFTEAWAGASWTKPSHATLLTGQPPLVHAAQGYEDALHPAVPTLAERLSAAGYATAAVVQDVVHLDPRFGFHRGFDDYWVEDWSAGQMARWAARWMGAHRDRPFFFFLHTFEAHSDFRRLPYEAPTVTGPALAERFDLAAGYGCEQSLEGDLNAGSRVCASARLDGIRAGTVLPLLGEDAILRYLYGEGVRHVDDELGRLFEDLRRLGVWDELMVVVTSDHGELLLETERAVLHGVHRPAVLRVPLIIKWPASRGGARRAGLRREEPVSAIDVMPTILEAAGVSLDGAARAFLPGADLRGRLDPARPLLVGGSDLSLIAGDRLLTRLQDGGLRLMTRQAGVWLELRNAAVGVDSRDELTPVLDRMIAESLRIRAELDRSGTPAKPPLSEEERARLRAFGYTDF